MSENNVREKVFLLDAYALIYRSYYAFIRNPRHNSKGLNTSAMLGFTNTLVQLLDTEKPEHIGVVFDVSKPTFRHEMYPEYKATREEMPEDLRKSIPYIRKIIEGFNIPILEMEGFEADDVIGTLARKADEAGYDAYMMTPDKDYCQLVNDHVIMYKPAKAGDVPEIWGPQQVKENFGISDPLQVIDILGLMGDASDNIPGCPGIGPKNAEKLIATYGSIDGIYNHIDEIAGKQKENLIEYEKQVRMSRELATINRHVPIEFEPEKLKMDEPNKAALKDIFDDLEFRSLSQRMQINESVPNEPVQGTLFASDAMTAVKTKGAADITTVPHHYYLVENEMQRASLRAELSVQTEFCFDTETTGLDPHSSELVCISFSFRKNEAFCVLLPPNRKQAQPIVEEFRLIFEDEHIVKIGQNIKYDMLMLLQYGIQVRGKLYDTMIAHYLIQPELRHNLDYLCEVYLDYKKIPTEDLIGKKGANQLNMRVVSVDKLKDYSCEDADLTYRLKLAIDPELDKMGVRKLFQEIEMPLINVLADVEMTGVTINVNDLNEYAKVLRQQIIDLEEDIFRLAGEVFNLSSPKQLGPILFEKLKIDTNARKTKTQQYSTEEEVLVRLKDRHPIVNKILDHRGLKKLLNTYVETLPLLISKRTGRIHTSYNQAIAATGRLSSNNPNLQNIPIRDDNGREIRRAFIPSDPQHVFLSADYSQIELRIMAALSNDHQMIKAFREGMDIHATTASRIFNVPVEEVTSDMRRKAKTANFGIIYGISAFGLSERLNISRTEAKELIDGYFRNFPGIKQYMDESIKKARNEGFVQTIMGRKRYLSDINSANSVVRGMAERNAINTPIQGSAADIIKIAMVNIFRRFGEENLKSKMIMQVHDELDFDVFKPELEKVMQIVKSEMENAVGLTVPLIVEMQAADNWLDAH